jgi:galactokinase
LTEESRNEAAGDPYYNRRRMVTKVSISLGNGVKTYAASAPGRADFLNTHQDYKGLPVVPVALDLRTYAIATETHSPRVVEITSLDLKERGEEYQDRFTIGENLQYSQQGFFGNYLRAVANVLLPALQKRAWMAITRDFGLNVLIKSYIPISSGLASSAALEVAFARLLDQIYHLGLRKKSIAEASYLAENAELQIPCGRLDQYGSCFGGVTLVDCSPPYDIKPIPFTGLHFVVADSGIRHSTAEIHPARQSELDRGLQSLIQNKSMPERLKKKLAFHYDEAKWSELKEEELLPYLSSLDDVARKRILFTLRMQRSTEIALSIMWNRKLTNRIMLESRKVLGLEEPIQVKRGWDVNSRLVVLQSLGHIMNYQHILLRDLYDVSLPNLERIWESMLNSDSFGAKISGAGLGGSVIALVENSEIGKKTLSAALQAGAKQGWISDVGTGTRIENPKNNKVQAIIAESLR